MTSHTEEPRFVECSCGAMTEVRFDPKLPSADGKSKGRYYALKPGWRFDPKAKRSGWHCGKEDHYQLRP